MERQLVQHGESTLMISLPKKWLDQQKMKKGDSMSVIPYQDRIIVTPQARQEESKEITVRLHTADYEDTRSILGKLYREGYQKITVQYDNPECIYYIQLIAKAIHGFEILEQREKSCTIRNITKELSLDVEEALSKVINIVKTEFLLVKEYLKKGVKGKEYEIRMLRDDCWKYRNMIYLHLKETLLSSAFDNYFKIHIIEYNATFLYWLYHAFSKSSVEKISPDFFSVFDSIAEYFNRSLMAFKDGKEYIQYILSTREKLLKECERYSLKKNDDRFLALYLSMLVQNIQNPKSLIV